MLNATDHKAEPQAGPRDNDVVKYAEESLATDSNLTNVPEKQQLAQAGLV